MSEALAKILSVFTGQHGYEAACPQLTATTPTPSCWAAALGGADQDDLAGPAREMIERARTATAPDGRTLHSHSPPIRTA